MKNICRDETAKDTRKHRKKKNYKERRIMSQKERVDLIEVDLLDMCKYILSKWIFILIGMVVFAGAGFGYAKVKSVTEYSSKMQVYVTVPKTSDKVLIRDNASEMVYDYAKLVKTDLIIDKVAKKAKVSKNEVKEAISAEVVEGTRLIEIKVKSDNQKDVKKISEEVLPVLQKVVQKDLGRNKLVIADYPSKITSKQTKSVKKFAVVGAAGGFVIVAGILFVIYLVNLSKKVKENIR